MTKALLLDDSKPFLNILHNALSIAGIVVISTSNKRDFNYYLKTFKPDVVLIDVFQERTDGRMICKQISEDSSTSHIPVILMSENPYALENYTSYGASDIIEKSQLVSEMIEKIKKAVKNTFSFAPIQNTVNQYTEYHPSFINKISFSSFAKMFF